MSDRRSPPDAVPGPDEDTALPDLAISPADNHDSPWKFALEAIFPQAIQLFAPDLYTKWHGSIRFTKQKLLHARIRAFS